MVDSFMITIAQRLNNLRILNENFETRSTILYGIHREIAK